METMLADRAVATVLFLQALMDSMFDSVATRVIVLEDGPGGKPKLTDWKGNYREYRLAREME